MRPVEGPRHDALALAIEVEGVVRRCRAEPGPPDPARAIEIGAGIDQHRLPIDIERNGKRVGVAVRGDGKVTQGAVVEAQGNLVAGQSATPDGEAALGKVGKAGGLPGDLGWRAEEQGAEIIRGRDRARLAGKAGNGS